MGQFLKDNSYNMVKLFINQVVMTMFGTMLAIATSKNHSLLLAASIFSVLFYLYLIYMQVWELGAKDKIRVDAGHQEAMPLKGLYLLIGANLPNLLLAVLMGIGVMIDAEWANSMAAVCNAIARLLNGMYLGVINAAEDLFAVTDFRNMWWWFFVIILPALFMGWLSYHFGAKDITIAGLLGIKKKPADKNNQSR